MTALLLSHVTQYQYQTFTFNEKDNIVYKVQTSYLLLTISYPKQMLSVA